MKYKNKIFDLSFYGTGNAFSQKTNTSFTFTLNMKDDLHSIFIFEVPMSTTKQIMLDADYFDDSDIDQIVICISHLHEDHVGGLSTLLAWFKYVKNISLENKIKIVCPDVEDMMLYLKLTMGWLPEQMPKIIDEVFHIDLEDNDDSSWNQIYIEPIEVKHCDGMKACGFDVIAFQYAVREHFYYTGDCVEIPSGIVNALNHDILDFIIGEISEYPISDDNVHCSYEFYNENFEPAVIEERIIFVHNNFNYHKVLNKPE